VRSVVSFDYQMFFNLLLPPIILSAGYELHQVRSIKLLPMLLLIYDRGISSDTLVLFLPLLSQVHSYQPLYWASYCSFGLEYLSMASKSTSSRPCRLAPHFQPPTL
jgi:hypothetical protein